MDFDYSTETITPDNTTLLTIGGTGAIEVPVGNTANRPVTGLANGALRYNTDINDLEGYINSGWTPISTGSSAVVASFSAGTTGFTPSSATTGAVTLAGTLNVANGGTGLSSTPANGALDIGNGAGFTRTTLTAGTAIGITNAAGSITINNTGVTAIAGTAGNITLSGSTGSVTVNLATAGTAGTYGAVTTDAFGRVTSGNVIAPVANGGTGIATATANGIIYGNTTSAFGVTAAGTATQVLTGSAGAPVWSNTPTLTGTNFTGIPNGALTNSTITVTGGTGLGVSGSPVALGGTVTLSNTGVTSNVAGTGISVSGATGAVTITNTGVTSNVAGTNITVSGATGAVTIGLVAAPTITGTNITGIPNAGLTNSSVTIGSTNIALGATSTTLAGMTGITFSSGTVTGLATPSASTDAATKAYVDSSIQGLSWKQAVLVATTANITLSGTQTIDGVAVTAGARVLVKNQTTTSQNGIYVVAAGAWSRAADSTTAAQIDGEAVYVQQGTSFADTGWTETATIVTVGTDPIVYAQFSGSGAYTAGTGLSLTGNVFANTGVLSVTTNTGLSTNVAATGAVTITNTGVTSFTSNTGLSANVSATGAVTVTNTGVTSNVAGTGISVSGATGAVTITNTGVTSAVAGTGIGVSGATGAVTFSNSGVLTISGGTTGLTPSTATAGAVTLGGTLVVANGGTGATTLGANGVLLGNGTSAVTATSVGATGTVLAGNTAAAPTFQTLSGLAVTSLSGTANQITASASTGAVTLSTPSTFIAPGSIASTTTLTAGTGLTVTSGGALVSAGGVTVSSLTANSFLYSGTAGLLTTTTAPTNGQLLIGSTGAAPVAATLSVSGTSIYVTNGAGSITLAGPKFYSEFTTAPVNAPTATASQAVAIGTGAKASTYGVLATANGQFATAGDAQALQAVYRYITTTTGAQELFLDGAGALQRLVLPANSAWTFTIKVAARRTDATGTIGSWIFTGVIYQDATVTTTTLVGLSKTTIARVGNISGAANDPTVSADTTNGSLKISVPGIAGNTIRWVATADLAQVTN